MKIVFVRHGHPDYRKDCLTDEGIVQAHASAEKMMCENVSKVYSSTRGRAMQTAKIFADKVGLEVIPLDFMREISWGYEDGSDRFSGGHPWIITDLLCKSPDYDVIRDDWTNHEYFRNNICVESIENVRRSFAQWIKQFGYRFEESGRIFCEEGSDDIVAIYSHGGSGASALSKIFNMTFPHACNMFAMNLTSISVVELPKNENSFIMPKLIRLNDDSHIRNKELFFGK